MCHLGASRWGMALVSIGLAGCGGTNTTADGVGADTTAERPEQPVPGAGGGPNAGVGDGGDGPTEPTEPVPWQPWAHAVGADVYAVATDSAGNVVIATWAPPAGGMSTRIAADLTVRKLDPLGVELWSTSYSGECSSPLDLVVTPDDQIWLACRSGDQLYLETTLGPTGEIETYAFAHLVHLSKDGIVSHEDWWTTALDAGANPLLAMSADGELFTSDSDGVFALRAADGTEQWRVPAPVDGLIVADLAVAADGDVLVTGSFTGAVGFDGGALGADLATGTKLFVARYDGAGQLLWTEAWPLATSPRIAPAPDGGFVLCGQFETPFELGEQRLDPGGTREAFLAGFDAAGAVRFSRSFPVFCTGLDVTSDGTIAMIAGLPDVVDLGAGEIGSPDNLSVLYAQFASDGSLIGNAAFLGTDATFGRAIAIHPHGGALLVGAATGTIDFGFEQLVSAPGFVARLELPVPK